MKRVILNFQTKNEDLEELLNEALKMDYTNFLISKETYSFFT